MCGIAGYFSTRAREDLSQALHCMTDAITHRGPDDEGYFESTSADGRARVGLGHRRLSIIDLTTGHQPLGNADGTVQIVFNGEIYNFESLREELRERGYLFRTRSDTETIVHAYQEWGPDCVTRLRGMFAFAIWDARRSRLFLARDRFGKKPLFIYEHGGVLLFASEIKALLQFAVGTFGKTDGEGPHWQARMTRHQRDYRRGIDAAGQERTKGHIGDHPDAHRFLE